MKNIKMAECLSRSLSDRRAGGSSLVQTQNNRGEEAFSDLHPKSCRRDK